MGHRHRAAFALGLTLAVLNLLPPVIAVADQRMLFHIAQEMLLLALVIPLIAYGAGPALGRHLAIPIQPLAGILALNISLFSAQLPAVVNAVSRDRLLHAAVQILFMVGAFIFWWPILRPGLGQAGLTPIAKVGYLIVASVPPTIPGLALAFSRHLFYAPYRSIDDQQLAGLLLFATAKLALVTGTFIILWRLLAPEAEPPEDDDRRTAIADAPPPAPAWYASLDSTLPSEPAPARHPEPLSAER